MVTMPAIVWRGGAVYRGVLVGIGAGVFFGALAWLDSGMLIAGAVVFVVVGVGSGVWMAYRMARYWPGGHDLTGAQRVAVVDAARRGLSITDATLGPAVADYSRGLHAAAEKGRQWRWVVVLVLVVALVTAFGDALFGSVGNAVASFVYLILGGLELFWWPKRQAELLANAERATDRALPGR